MNSKLINVFDFDGTIYDGDSTLDFYKYCLRKNPKLIFYLPRQILGAVKYKMKIIDKTTFKEEFYSFLLGIDDIDYLVNQFWNENQHKVFSWYKDISSPEDVIISASPEFLLATICKRLDVKLICSLVDKNTGKYDGVNCYGKEKVKRFIQAFGEGVKINHFYSDSYSDQPMANIARKAFFVKDKKPSEWEK